MTVPMQLVASCLSAILALPIPWFPPNKPLPETTEQREQRIKMVLEETVEASYDVLKEHPTWEVKTGWTLIDLVAMSVAQAYNESAFAYEVHSGQGWPGRPPPLGDKGRAACLWQMQISATQVPFDEWRPFEREQWATLVGTDRPSTRRCAQGGVRIIAYHAWRCQTPLRKFNKRTDHRWPAAHVLAEYNQPTRWGVRCSRVTSDSIRWAATYHLVRRKIHADMRAHNEQH